MNDKKSTPLREKMKADLMLRNYSKPSEELYLFHVRRFAQHYHKSPGHLGLDEIRSYLTYLRQEANVSQSSYKQTVAALKDGNVSFSYKDYRTNEKKLMTLPAVEFIRRFLLHVLPNKFVRVRYYGFLTRAKKLAALSTIREALETHSQAPPPKPATTPHRHCCPACKLGKLVHIGQVPRCSIPGTSPPAQHTALS